MKKESLMAIFFGLFLGLIFSLFLINQSKNQKISQIKPIKNQTKVVTPTVKSLETAYLEILEPKPSTVVNSSTLTIKGKANKNYLILVVSPLKEIIFKNEKESFTVEMPLALGENPIQINLYLKDKSIPLVNKSLTVYYLTQND